MTLAERFAAVMAVLLPASLPQRLGLAVSGGSDSLALMALAADWAAPRSVALTVFSVDHGLRLEAASEVAAVGAAARASGLGFEPLQWNGWDGQGNLQNAAREARRALIARRATDLGIAHIALGHTRDDQAETLLLRLARGSGVDGLAAMAGRRETGPVTWLRPLLDITRAELRAELTRRGIGWTEDPSNDDTRFDRVRARRIMAALAPLGVSADRLAQTAAHMGRARAALEDATDELSAATTRLEAGDLVIARPEWLAAPQELRDRLLASGLCFVSGQPYRPRYVALVDAIDAVKRGRRTVLHGCLLLPDDDELRLTREPAAVCDHRVPASEIWDGRWQMIGPASPGLEIAALGEAGLAQCPKWRERAVPHAGLPATPALWHGDRLVAAPFAGWPNGWTARLVSGRDTFRKARHSH